MPGPDFYREVRGLIKSDLLIDEPMKLHTSWRIGGPADIFVDPVGAEDLGLLLKQAVLHNIPITVIGAGSNMLVRDGGIRGLVIRIGSGFSDISIEGTAITAGGGVKLSRLAAAARDACIGGLEFLAGIPGTVGGAVVMNAGANGSSVSALVSKVVCIDYNGNTVRLEKEEMGWGYRTSGLQDRDLIVIEAVFNGYRRGREEISSDMERNLRVRKEAQPLELPNSGSVFKNPPGNYAGKLIQEAGCQGLRVGDAQVSTKHANFIVNLGGARASHVLELIEEVKARVRARAGVTLEMEVKVLGCD
ncbi:MAG: UDP-N-acetylmuramate dehydrogenase [Bacillota bacterium]